MWGRNRFVLVVGAALLMAGCGSDKDTAAPASYAQKSAEACLAALADHQRALAGADDVTRANGYGYLPPGCDQVGDDLPKTAEDLKADALLAEADAQIAAAGKDLEAATKQYPAEAAPPASDLKVPLANGKVIRASAAKGPREKRCQAALYKGIKRSKDGTRLSDDAKTTRSVRSACRDYLDDPKTFKRLYLLAVDQANADLFK